MIHVSWCEGGGYYYGKQQTKLSTPISLPRKYNLVQSNRYSIIGVIQHPQTHH
jgi:hypothetical protein